MSHLLPYNRRTILQQKKILFYKLGYIRLLLAVSVFQGHAWEFFKTTHYSCAGGIVSVRMFYMISGFLMALMLTTKYDSVVNFYKSRILRLFPTYYCVLVGSIVVALIIWISTGSSFTLGFFHGYGHILGMVGWTTLIVPQIFLLGIDLVGFLAIDFINNAPSGLKFTNSSSTQVNGYQFLIIPQAWTLGLELSFYLLIPWIIKSTRIILILFFISIGVQFLTFYILDLGDDPWNRRFFLSELQYFLGGVLCFKLKTKVSSQNGRVQLVNFSLILMMLILLSSSLMSPIPLVLIYLAFALSLPNLINISRVLPLDRLIGDLSYPLYIVHWFVLNLVLNGFLPNFNWPKTASLAYSIFLSLLLIFFVERKMDLFRSKYSKRLSTQ
tara:strand:+ start:9995 stop:11146 length:1152 start_codon:yes stop_codon:yes gene_type:complete